MFRTELPLVPALQQLPLSARILTIGSCFSETIGGRLAAAKVSTLANPFGTVFSPVAACKLLRAAAGEDTDWQQHLVEARDRWQSYDLHASIGADSPVELLQTLQQLLRDTGVFLATADVVVLTLGTAWAYRLKETEELVSNCHKMPAEKFDKELLTPDEIINAVAETHAYLRLRNPKLRFVLTVSPVRHLKDTLPLNAVSKSVLRVACHYLSELLPDVSYFPAYELLLDDLRDYRFYAADMLHPSPVAEDYIWERFARTYFDADFGRFRKEWDSVRQALNHRPLYAAAPEHREFLLATLERLERLSGKADMRMEILDIRRQLQNLPVPKPQPALPVESEDDEERIDIGIAADTPLLAREHHEPVVAMVALVESEPDVDETEGQDDAEDLAEGIVEVGQPKKKRRNRGGAKRNKKKYAARLAEEAAAAGLELQPTTVPEADSVVDSSLPEEAAAEPAVAVTFDPDAVLQTALERRKRGSRRNRGGRKPLPEPAEEATALFVDDVPAPEVPEAPEPTALDFQEATAPESATENTLPEDERPAVTEPIAALNSQRPVRTGRSASEVRAAALRKPRRPDSRIKTLYATPPETPADSETAVPESAQESLITDPSVSIPVDATPASAVVPAVAATQPPTTAIPVVKGTGASGRLSAAGKATLTSGAARPQPASVAPSLPQEVLPPVATEPPVAELPVAESAVESESSVPDASTAVVSAPEPITEPTPATPKRQPARAASKKPASKKAEPKSVASKPAVKASKKVKATPEAVPPADDPTASAPSTRRRKPASTAATVPPVAAAPKRASRRKPAAPDDSPETA